MRHSEITVGDDGAIGLRWVKPDGGFHRCVIPCGDNIRAQLAAVQADPRFGGKLDEEGTLAIEQFAAIEWTPARRKVAADGKAELARQAAERKAELEARALREAQEKADAEAKFLAAVDAAVARRLSSEVQE